MHESSELDAYRLQVDALSVRLGELGRAARAVGAESLETRVRQTSAKLESKPFLIAVVGAFSTGKSTLINALVRQDILPTAARECTVVLTRVLAAEPGAPTSAVLTLATGAQVNVPAGELQAVLTTSSSEYSGEQVVGVTVSMSGVDWLERGVEIVDTPGINAAGLRSERTTLDFMPRADAIIFLTRADRLLTEDEFEFLRDRVLAEERDRIFVVVNAVDRIENEEDRKGLARRCAERLDEVLPGARVRLVSAIDACYAVEDENEPAWAASGVPALVGDIERFLASERATAQIERFHRAYEALRHELRTSIRQRLDALTLDEELRQQRVHRVEELLEYAKRDEEDLVANSIASFEQLRKSQRQRVAEAGRQLGEKLSKLNRGGQDAARSAAERAVAKRGRAVLGGLQESFRREIPKIHHRLAEQVGVLFDKMDGAFKEETVVVLADLDFESLVSTMTVEIAEEERVLVPGRSSGSVGKSDAWIGAGVGALVGGLLLGPFGFWAMGAIGYGMTERVKESEFFETITQKVSRSKIDVRDVVKRFEAALMIGVEEAVGGISGKTATDLRLIVRTKRGELGDRLEDLKKARDGEGAARVETLRAILKSLTDRALPEGSGA